MLIFAALLSVLPLVHAPAATLNGVVRAEGSQVPIAGVTVEIAELSRGTLTDERGYFALVGLPEGEWTVRVTALGFSAWEQVTAVGPSGSTRLEISLAAQPVELAGVTARTQGGVFATDAGPSPISIDAGMIEQIPVLVEPDILRALQTLPSVQAASDFSSALYVRGGLPDQNLMTLDGAPLFNPFHMGGLFSAFDASAIQSVDLLPGAFPAHVGDRVSSAVDIRTRDGGRDRLRGSGGVGLISSRLSLDGPLPGGGGSYLASFRRTYLDLFTDVAHSVGAISTPLPYAFTDAHLKLSHDVGSLGRLSFSMYLDDEGFRYPDLSVDQYAGELSDSYADFSWGAWTGSLNYWQPFGSTWTVEANAGVSHFGGSFLGIEAERERINGQRQITGYRELLSSGTTQRDLYGRVDLSHQGRSALSRFGIQLDRYLFDHHLTVGERAGGLADVFEDFAIRDQPATVAAYAESEWDASESLSLRAGLRGLSAGNLGTAILPRLGMRYDLSPRISLSLAGSRSAQVMRSLRSDESVWSSLLAYDLLVAVPADQGPTLGSDVVAGFEWSGARTRIRLDGYQKWADNLPIPPVPGDLVESPIFVRNGVRSGQSSAHGLEVMAQHARGDARYSVGYAWTSATQQLGELSYQPRFTRPHMLDASASWPWGESGSLSARLALGSGQGYTPIVERTLRYPFNPATGQFEPNYSGPVLTPVFGEHNSARLPGYFRVDVGARRDFTANWFGRETTLTPYLSILNVLNTPNVLFAIPSDYGALQLEYPPQIPLFPTLGLDWRF